MHKTVETVLGYPDELRDAVFGCHRNIGRKSFEVLMRDARYSVNNYPINDGVNGIFKEVT